MEGTGSCSRPQLIGIDLRLGLAWLVVTVSDLGVHVIRSD